MAHNTRPTIQLSEICQALGVPDRQARYVLEKGFVPAGIEPAPASGHHRQFTSGQAFWLAMVLKLKEAGVKTPVAACVANYAYEAVRTISKNLGWDPDFSPANGQLATTHQYLIDVAEYRYVRLVTDAEPSSGRRLRPLDWHEIKKPGKPYPELRPCVALRLDLSEIGRRLATAFSSSGRR